jgi:hypothetical protein
MENVSVVVGVLAMFVALAAVFFASLAMKKTDEAYDTFLHAHIDPLAAELVEIKGTLNKTKKLAESQQTDFAGLKEIKQDLTDALRDVEIRLNALKEVEPAKPAKPAKTPTWPG